MVVSYGENVVDDWFHSPNIPQIRGQIWRVTFISEAKGRFLWTVSPQRSRCSTIFLIGDTYSESTGPETLLCRPTPFVSVFRLQHKPKWLLCAEVVFAVGDLHGSTVIRKFIRSVAH